MFRCCGTELCDLLQKSVLQKHSIANEWIRGYSFITHTSLVALIHPPEYETVSKASRNIKRYERRYLKIFRNLNEILIK